MLVKSSNVQQKHGHKLAILAIFFLSLVLMLSFANIVPAGCCGSTSNTSPNYIDVESGETMEIAASGVVFSANSRIFVGKIWWDFSAGHDLKSLRWNLYNAEGDIVYYKEADWHETDDAQDKGYINDPEIVVPNFPQQGRWQLKLSVDMHWTGGMVVKDIYLLGFNVGESSFVDNIMAPLCITYNGLPYVKWGEFSHALPCIFWLTSPAWGLGILFLGLALYTRSFKLAAGLIKEGGKRFKEAITKKS